MHITPYLFFEGRCEEAIEFYRKALDAQVTMMMRYKDNPDPQEQGRIPPDKIMHAHFRIGDTEVNASDGESSGKPNFQGFRLSLTVANEAEAKRRFAALAEGGQVQLQLTNTFFSPCFGMLTDRFGMPWMVYVAQAQ